MRLCLYGFSGLLEVNSRGIELDFGFYVEDIKYMHVSKKCPFSVFLSSCSIVLRR